MNNLQNLSIGSTFGIGVILAGSMGTPFFHDSRERDAFIGDPVLYSIGSTAASASNSAWSVAPARVIRGDGDFQSIAIALAAQQESLGEDFEMIIANHFADFLD